MPKDGLDDSSAALRVQEVTLEELHEIRRLWLYEKHEFDDCLPRIYEEITGSAFPQRGDEASGLRADDWDLLREVCGDDRAFFHLQVSLLGVERQFRGMSRRAGIFEELQKRLRTGLYGSEEEAVTVIGRREQMKEKAREAGLFARELPMVEKEKGTTDEHR
jgi:DNA sulfur modification protein DndC